MASILHPKAGFVGNLVIVQKPGYYFARYNPKIKKITSKYIFKLAEKMKKNQNQLGI